MNEFKVIEGERITTYPAPHVREMRFKLKPFGTLTCSSAQPYLVKGLIPAGGLILVWGKYKSGKSFLVFDLMMHVALGWKYRGRNVLTGPVVYCAFEGASGIANRAEAFRIRNLQEQHDENIPFWLMTSPVDLAQDHSQLVQDIQASLGATHPVVVVLDTLNRSLGGSESSDEHMTAYIKAADAIREAFGCAVVIVHHCGTDESRPRGHTSLTAAIDAQLAVKRNSDGVVSMKVEWMKDGPEGDKLYSKLESVEVGRDIDGDAITSCVVVAAEKGNGTSDDPAAGKKLGQASDIALAALESATEQYGIAGGDSDPPDALSVSVDQWRQCAYSAGISESSEARARQLAFQRAQKTLIARGRIRTQNNRVWLLAS